MTIRTAAKQALSSLLRPLALAVPVFACVALSGCDDPAAPLPESGDAWIVAQLEQVRDLPAQEQAEHFEALADDLAVAQAHAEPRPSAPTLDLAGTDEIPTSELQQACDIMTGCIDWSAQHGCILAQQCYICSASDWSCIIISGHGY